MLIKQESQYEVIFLFTFIAFNCLLYDVVNSVPVLLLFSGRGDMEQNDSDNRRIIRYPDSHQLFVGNLPHDIDENELKEFFMSKWSVLVF